MPTIELPAGVLAFAERGADWAAFVDRLPAVVAALLSEWDLGVEPGIAHGNCALVVPVRSAAGPAVLKVAFPDDESEHEALALQHWAGNGAARLLRADPHRRAMLLERLHRRDLNALGDVAACEVVGGLYGRLHIAAMPQLRSLTSYLARWNADLAALPRDAPVPRRLVEQAVSLGRDLEGDPDTTGRLVHGDLHYDNVLAGDREPWLVIDPKAMSGDPHYEPAPMLRNRWEEVIASGDVRGAVRRRFHALVDSGGLDEDRARDWVVVRMLHNASWEIADDPSAPDREWLTMCVAIAKAVQD